MPVTLQNIDAQVNETWFGGLADAVGEIVTLLELLEMRGAQITNFQNLTAEFSTMISRTTSTEWMDVGGDYAAAGNTGYVHGTAPLRLLNSVLQIPKTIIDSTD